MSLCPVMTTDHRILKYSKLKGHLPEVLAKDQVSAIAVGTRIIVSSSMFGKANRTGTRDTARNGARTLV